MQQSLFAFVWQNSMRQQITVLIITVFSFPILYLSLELPKIIINDAIGDEAAPFPRDIFGYTFEQVPYLLLLCFGFLGLVVLNNVVKYVLNVYKGLLGERMLRRLRYELFHRILRFRLPHFRRVSQGELIPMITAEVEQIGGFIGEAIATPAFQGGTLLVYIFFIFNQDPLLGAAAIALYPVQAYIIPKLQVRVNRLSRERVLNTRKLADRIGESISGVAEIHANDTAAWHLADVSERLYTNFKIRFRIFRLKYQIKFLNNFLNQLTPFFFYSIGGYLVIVDQITFGALVAVLAAYKDLAGPWRELLAWYQQLMDMRVKYQTVVENFDVPDMMTSAHIDDDPGDTVLDGPIKLESITVASDAGGDAVSGVSLEVAKGATVAIVGADGSGRAEVVEAISGAIPTSAGRVRIGDAIVGDVPESVLGRQLSYMRAAPYVFNGTLRSNLLYGIRHRPVSDAVEADEADLRQRKAEAERTANTTFDFNADWNDLSAVGATQSGELDAIVLKALDTYGLGNDVFRMGLLGRLDPEHQPETAAVIVESRAAVAEMIRADKAMADLVEFWGAPGVMSSAPLLRSVFGAVPADPDASTGDLLDKPGVLEALEAARLDDDLLALGESAAETLVELFGSMPDTQLLASLGLSSSDDLAELQTILKGTDRAARASRRKRLIAMALDIVPQRHRFVTIPDSFITMLGEAAPRLHDKVAKIDGKPLVFLEPDHYIAPLSVFDNLVFGQPRLERVNSRETLEKAVAEFVRSTGLTDTIARIGLDFQVGVGGGRLSPAQRRTVGFVRGLLRRPNYVVVEDVASAPLPPEELLEAIRREVADTTIVLGGDVWDPGSVVDRVIQIENGRVASDEPGMGAGDDPELPEEREEAVSEEPVK